MNDSQTMREYVIEISTDVFHVLQQQAPGYVSWGEEKPGPTQKILLGEDVYTEFIDRAIRTLRVSRRAHAPTMKL